MSTNNEITSPVAVLNLLIGPTFFHHHAAARIDASGEMRPPRNTGVLLRRAP